MILDRSRRFVVQFRILALAQHGQGLEPCDRQHPCGDSGAAFKPRRLPPHIEENLTDEIFRRLLVLHEPQCEAIDPYMVPRIQHLHGQPVAFRDPGDQDFV